MSDDHEYDAFEEALDDVDPLSFEQAERAMNFFMQRQWRQVKELKAALHTVAEKRAAYERAFYTRLVTIVSTKEVAATAAKDVAKGDPAVLEAAEALYLAEAERDMIRDSQQTNRSNIEGLRSLMANLRPLVQ